ncbi:putative 1,3-beta-glucan synthase [Helianthus debilis subsp. tardiflorus]
MIFACKLTFAYFLQIKPLVEPTNIIKRLPPLAYSRHDLVSKNNNNNVLTLVSIWAPIGAVSNYFSFQSANIFYGYSYFYTLLSVIIGGVMGARARLGEVWSIEMVHKRFESFPKAFVDQLVPKQPKNLAMKKKNRQDVCSPISPILE